MSQYFPRRLDSMITLERGRVMSKELKRLYEVSFPTEERRPQNELESNILANKTALWIIKADDLELGFITLYTLPSGVSYIEHFAIDNAIRGRGAGSQALSLLTAMTGTPIVLEVEPERSNEMATRRIGFYRRLGFRLWDNYHYHQPAYSGNNISPGMRLMTLGIGEETNIHHLATELRKYVYGAREENFL